MSSKAITYVVMSITQMINEHRYKKGESFVYLGSEVISVWCKCGSFKDKVHYKFTVGKERNFNGVEFVETQFAYLEDRESALPIEGNYDTFNRDDFTRNNASIKPRKAIGDFFDRSHDRAIAKGDYSKIRNNPDADQIAKDAQIVRM
jgi:hypothetical protein